MRASGFDGLRGGQQLLAILDGAGSSHNDGPATADGHIANLDDRVLGLESPADEFIRRRELHNVFHGGLLAQQGQ